MYTALCMCKCLSEAVTHPLLVEFDGPVSESPVMTCIQAMAACLASIAASDPLGDKPSLYRHRTSHHTSLNQPRQIWPSQHHATCSCRGSSCAFPRTHIKHHALVIDVAQTVQTTSCAAAVNELLNTPVWGP